MIKKLVNEGVRVYFKASKAMVIGLNDKVIVSIGSRAKEGSAFQAFCQGMNQGLSDMMFRSPIPGAMCGAEMWESIIQSDKPARAWVNIVSHQVDVLTKILAA